MVHVQSISHTKRCDFFFFQAEDGIRDVAVTGVQTCALPISLAGGVGSEEHLHLGIMQEALLRLPPFLTAQTAIDRKSTRLNSSHGYISYAVFCLKKKKKTLHTIPQ